MLNVGVLNLETNIDSSLMKFFRLLCDALASCISISLVNLRWLHAMRHQLGHLDIDLGRFIKCHKYGLTMIHNSAHGGCKANQINQYTRSRKAWKFFGQVWQSKPSKPKLFDWHTSVGYGWNMIKPESNAGAHGCSSAQLIRNIHEIYSILYSLLPIYIQ